MADVGELTAGRLISELDRCPPELLGRVAADVIVSCGLAETVSIWLIDYGFDKLTDLVNNNESSAVQGTIVGRVANKEVGVLHGGRVYFPLARRGQVIGVIELSPADEETMSQLPPVAVALSSALLATGLISDVVERIRGSSQLSLPATIQHRNLPITSYVDERVELGGRLEPAYDIAGDVIDYAVNPEGIHLALFDAVGHGLRATTLSTWAVSAYRLLRRQGASLKEMVAGIDELVAENSDNAEFVTGVIVIVRPAAGIMEIANAGHPPPLLIRDGASHFLDPPSTRVPFGLGTNPSVIQASPSQPGDVIFLYSDGVVQARDPAQQMFGVEPFGRQAVDRTMEGLSLTYICRQILDSVIAWSVDRLADDASIVALRRRA